MEYKILEEMFRGESPKSVFEIGCANGGLLKDLKDHYQGLIVGGMETSECINKSVDQFGPTHFYRADINDPWPIPDKSYDIVFSVGVLMYMFDPIPVLKEMLRVGKKVIIAEPHDPNTDLFGHLSEGGLSNGKMQSGIVRNYSDLIERMNIPVSVIHYESSQGKTIFKIQHA